MGSKPKTTKYSSKKQSGKMSTLKWLFRTGFKVGLVLAGLLALLCLFYAIDLPDVKDLGKTTRQREIILTSPQGEVLASYGDKYSDYVKFERFPKVLINAVVATEDRRFFSHFGVDPIGLLRAAVVNAVEGRVVQGGSTISQQLAKILFLSPERNLKRKIQELMLALYLEHNYTKQQILTIYLNKVYMGSGIYGVGGAAKYYFGKNIENINLQEAAIITGLLKAPSRYSPVNNIDLAGKRAYQVLFNMKDAGFISEKEFDKVSEDAVRLDTSALGSTKNMYFASYIVDQLGLYTHDSASDLIITTTLNPEMQEFAESAIRNGIEKHGKTLDIEQGAIVALDTDGAIITMIGGLDYNKYPYNRAVDAKRQAGSAFKPFVYAALFENTSYQPDSITEDKEITVNKWKPRNVTRQFLGEVTVREAFSRSINTVAVAFSEMVGRSNVIYLAHKLGIQSRIDAVPSLALGSFEVSLLELTDAYTSFANGGSHVTPYGILKITTKSGRVIFEHQGSREEQVLSNSTIAFMGDLMLSTIESPVGTGRAARLASHQAAGKTGTTSDYRDAWFIGYSGDIVAGVWVGNDDNHAMKKVTGGTVPAQIWREFMNKAVAGRPNIYINTAPMNGVEINHSTPTIEPLEQEQKDTDEFWQGIENMLEKKGE